MNIVGVTACLSGVAHTYMAAELLEKSARKSGYKIMVETQGALGVENRLQQDQIDAADVVVILADLQIEGHHRFDGARIVKMSITRYLHEPEKVMQAVEKVCLAPMRSVIDIN